MNIFKKEKNFQRIFIGIINLVIGGVFFSCNSKDAGNLSDPLAANNNRGFSFPGLTKASVDTTYQAYFGYDKSSRLINLWCGQLSEKDPLHCSDSDMVPGIVVARFKNAGMKDSINILYSQGMSADPEFSIYTLSGKRLGSFSAKELYINSSGTIYTAGHVNNMYDRRRKFQLETDTIKEVVQPYYYIGIKGALLSPVILYKEKEGADIVAELPKGYQVEILLGESSTKEYSMDSCFLVKTEFGLVGWMRMPGSETPVLKELYFAGD